MITFFENWQFFSGWLFSPILFIAVAWVACVFLGLILLVVAYLGAYVAAQVAGHYAFSYEEEAVDLDAVLTEKIYVDPFVQPLPTGMMVSPYYVKEQHLVTFSTREFRAETDDAGMFHSLSVGDTFRVRGTVTWKRHRDNPRERVFVAIQVDSFSKINPD